MLAVTEFSSCPPFLRAIFKLTWVTTFWTWAIFLSWQCPHNGGIILTIIDKHPGKGSLGTNSCLLRCDCVCVCKKNDGRDKDELFSRVLVPWTHLEQDLSLLTSYVPTSSEIVPPGSLYTHWRKEDIMMMWHNLPVLDVCGRVRWNTHQKDLFLPSKSSSDWWLEMEMLSTDHIYPSPSFQKRPMQVTYIGPAFFRAEILHLASPCWAYSFSYQFILKRNFHFFYNWQQQKKWTPLL